MILEEFISKLTKEDIELINRKFAKQEEKIPTFQYSKIRDRDLKSIVDIKRVVNRASVFKEWIENSISLSRDTITFLEKLLQKEGEKISIYNEEDLKMFFISQIINRVDFGDTDRGIRGFFENQLTYETEKFILNGTTDFVVSKGLMYSEEPYFFIQEFKRGEEFSNPRPQLVAELIAGVELNSWESIRGAYIVGENWNFVILEKLDEGRYQYFVSRTFNCTNIEDLKGIYRNLLFVKEEIKEIKK